MHGQAGGPHGVRLQGPQGAKRAGRAHSSSLLSYDCRPCSHAVAISQSRRPGAGSATVETVEERVVAANLLADRYLKAEDGGDPLARAKQVAAIEAVKAPRVAELKALPTTELKGMCKKLQCKSSGAGDVLAERVA